MHAQSAVVNNDFVKQYAEKRLSLILKLPLSIQKHIFSFSECAVDFEMLTKSAARNSVFIERNVSDVIQSYIFTQRI